MISTAVTVRDLLENRYRFCVPIYQRHYVWTKDKQWEPFWNDIRTKAIERLNDRERRFPHFMGAVVLETRDTKSLRQVTSFQVVDGQQRLTTFQLFLAAARNYAKHAGFEDTVGLIESYLLNGNVHLMENAEVDKYKVWPTKYDRDLFQNIISAEPSDLRDKYSKYFYAYRDTIYGYSTVPNLLGAYGYFFERIKHAVESDDLEDDFSETIDSGDDEDAELDASSEISDQNRVAAERRFNALWEALIEEFKIVEIILEDGDDAQVIFETLNDRGEPLLAADLVRNNIFYRADANGEDAEKLFENYWKEFEDPFWSYSEKQGRYIKARVELFLSNFITGMIASEVTLSKLFSEYKAFIKIQMAKPQGGYLTVEEELKDLGAYGKLYRRLLERDEKDPLGHFAELLHPWEVTTVYPLVLRIWAKYEVDKEERKECLSTLLTFIVRRAVCGLTTKNYNKFFLSVLRHLETEGFSRSNLANFLCVQTSESARLPSDMEFMKAWTSAPMYGSRLTSQRVRAVLKSIERSKRQKFHETDQLGNYLSVEHILPQSWQEHWFLSDGVQATGDETIQAMFAPEESETRIGEIVRRQRLLNTFGNLTLLTKSLNSSVSNGSYSVKREALNEYSLLVLNREIIEEEEWGEDQIEERGRNLFEVAKELWPYPS